MGLAVAPSVEESRVARQKAPHWSTTQFLVVVTFTVYGGLVRSYKGKEDFGIPGPIEGTAALDRGPVTQPCSSKARANDPGGVEPATV